MHRKLFNALWLVAAILVTSASAQEANKSKPEQASAVVRVDSGQLQGVEADGVISFKGIPFAAPPVGELRWRPHSRRRGGRECDRPRNSAGAVCRDEDPGRLRALERALAQRQHRGRRRLQLRRRPPRLRPKGRPRIACI